MPLFQVQTLFAVLVLLSTINTSGCAGTQQTVSEHTRRSTDRGSDVTDGITVYGTLSASISHIEH
ncbi:hypothetical protein [Halochromatium glycolicum]|uniref:Uncharacterized protein n=1 Tax=Halochromatium glycolicum TaxID=85075 RepID=A0AAJ0U878_9GAMM|nr:hypothetical protein [Halochromatium glycolicum]MBK1707129.1 hypothetical protein [Halochromatium glycolicum]